MTELLGFVSGAVCVYLTLKENIWNFPIGIANNIFFLALFLHGRLFGDASLQVIYILLGIQGWYQWLYGGKDKTALKVSTASGTVLWVVAVFVAVGTLGLYFAFRAIKDAAPLLDSVTTVLSLAAQYLLNKKAIENWHVWLMADLIYIYLYFSRGLNLTAVLYALFACLCVAGWITWRSSLLRLREMSVA